MHFLISRLALTASLSVLVSSQYFPPKPEGVTVVRSKFHEGVTISYKEPHLCETTEGVKSYSGYVHLPPKTVDEDGESQNYPINTFFWFFESRKDPHHAPLAIWMNGGPGGSSFMGLLSENGPCFVGNDSNSTYHNPWSWNNEVNMLYIDQPVQVGYSYDVPTNCTVIMNRSLEGNVTIQSFSDEVPEQNNTFRVGTLASQNLTYTSNTTIHAAHALWHFAQTFFEEMPVYKPHDEKISIWTESYGGKYGPAFTTFFMEQNEKIANGTINQPGAHYIHLDTLGIINGCSACTDEMRAYIDFAHNNTYGIQVINDTTYEKQIYEFEKPGGLREAIEKCQKMAREADPDDKGDMDEVNKYCTEFGDLEVETVIQQYFESGKYGWMDITHPLADPFPDKYYIGYLNQHWVQRALGVPVNHSMLSVTVSAAFQSTGDMIRGGILNDIAYVLDNGVKVALVYGDRDYACNWLGGEASSLRVNYTGTEGFHNAGYSPIEISPFYSGGQVRQYGNFSFSRVYQAGHAVPSYQPETAYKIFMRAMFNKDIATGRIDLSDDYSTKGASSTWHIMNDVLPPPKPECYILEPSGCSEELYAAVENGTAIIKDLFVIGIAKNGEVSKEPEDGTRYFSDGGGQTVFATGQD